MKYLLQIDLEYIFQSKEAALLYTSKINPHIGFIFCNPTATLDIYLVVCLRSTVADQSVLCLDESWLCLICVPSHYPPNEKICKISLIETSCTVFTDF